MILLKKTTIYELIPKLNMLMAISAVVLIAFLSSSLLRPYKINRNLTIKPVVDTKLFTLQDGKAIFQEDIFKQKKLFNESGKKDTSEPKKEFMLLGVSIGAKSLAMLRETRSKKDYYCAVGDMIGDFRVKQILKDRVILESEGNTLEIIR
jgi:type II secretory pathway component PulC